MALASVDAIFSHRPESATAGASRRTHTHQEKKEKDARETVEQEQNEEMETERREAATRMNGGWREDTPKTWALGGPWELHGIRPTKTGFLGQHSSPGTNRGYGGSA